MNKLDLSIWGRNFSLSIVFQNYPGESVTPEQQMVLQELKSIDFSKALPYVKDYLLRRDSSEFHDNQIDNIFRYVMPHSILIPRGDNKISFSILCNYRFDIEHGLAIVYAEGKCTSVCSSDHVL